MKPLFDLFRPRLGASAIAFLMASGAVLAHTPMPAPAAAASEPAAAVLAPNANLLVQGIPPVPQSLADAVGRYNDFRGHGFVAWHPSQREMLVTHRKAGANTAQLYRVSKPMAEPEQLTDAADPVSNASYEPRSGRYIVFARASGGNEVAQLYRLDAASKEPLLLTDPNQRHAMSGWLHHSSQMLFTSVPLDRTAAGGSRAQVLTQLWLMDPLKPAQKRLLAELPGGGWGVGAVSRDDKQIALSEYISANESRIWLLDIASGEKRQILPAAGEQLRASHRPAEFSHDNKSLLLLTNRFGEFVEPARYTFADAKLSRIDTQIPWDASGITLTEDGKRLALQFNIDGRDELRFYDARSFKPLPTPKLPAGSIGSAEFDRKRGELAFSINGAQGPSQLFTLDAKGAVQRWTQAYAPAGIDTQQFTDQQVVRWKSFDGREISGLLSLPPAKFTGKRPVVISIHGGPEGQSTVGFLGRNNYYLQELGVAFIQPNVRGSAGFGKTFLDLDNGFKREDSVKDIGALLDWIATQPNLDASRVLVMGGSYGGYMTLAVATNYPERIVGALDVVGISHFVTFLNNTESYRRDLRRVEYGDERDPAMKAHLEKISPLSNSAKIKAPLFVVQGKNDPRVPYTEAEQIVTKVREQGTPVWYLRADNEGHGFARKENQDYLFYSTIMFMQQTLLK
ncbi:prolyl oligopeptidase family serine peptidase [Paucibacter sp. TC2R-5]|uniref:S9 family peptidase n=1 Tax=Paucibacter sp. TC2R-5 TaxID=2893555 RepID=UPI0021E45876|nr:prolyl oligopeptidase family serine peptidase [Paucibacter sp. TC2R-5]MCV2360550.1 prolyl oligopeptidase family serine peptidase [Paucibacter sp. TC2R-5]